MKVSARKITPCLWFDTQAEEAAQFYVSIFKNSKINAISRYAKAGQEIVLPATPLASGKSP